MRALVVGAFRAGTHLAHAINTVKMAQGFARLGHEVTIVCRREPRGKVNPGELARIYGITEPLHWMQVPYLVGQHWGFSLVTLPALLRASQDLIFARNYTVPWVSSRMGITTVAESHAQPGTTSVPFLRLVQATHHPAFRLWVTISEHLADHYQSLGVPRDKLIVLPDAVDLQLFQRPVSLPPSPYCSDQPVVAYIGHLYDYKGIPTILQAAALLPEVGFHLVGGLPEDLSRQRARVEQMGLDNVTFHGLRPHSEVPPFLWHADTLLLPPSAHHPSAAWTSPLKVGEYLASGTPVVATSIPALRDWLSVHEVKFVPPDDAVAMADGILSILKDPDYSMSLSEAGLKKAQTLSYQHRAARVLERLATQGGEEKTAQCRSC